jgi:ribulose-5-phosphate 4-epimerase/fuculose-1-phosphate aldolase
MTVNSATEIGMLASSALQIESRLGQVSPQEWQLRVDLAAAYRAMALFGWDDLAFTHITARVPGKHDQFLINPYGVFFDEITASSLVRIDLEGNKLEDSPFPVNPTGFTIHGAVHGARHDAECVLHAHTANIGAVAAMKEGVLPLSQYAMYVVTSVGYHDFEGIAQDAQERPRIVRDLGDKRYLVMRNHGLVTLGPSVAETFLAMYLFESVCRMQLAALATGREFTCVSAAALRDVEGQIRKVTIGQGIGALNWPGLLRRLDRLDPSYRT